VRGEDAVGRREGSDPWTAWPPAFATSVADRRAALVLSSLRGSTPRRLLALAAELGTASAVLAEFREGRAGGPVDRALAREVDPDAVEAALAGCGARLVTWGTGAYPEQLRHVHDPPFALFVVGAETPDATAAVAVVGARRCSDLGRETASEIGRGLALAGITVVSGAARGIDAAAHEGALEAGGPTLAVLGCGIDVAYPRASRTLIERIRRTGAVVSELPPGTPPHPRHFPARNRIVAGLCRSTVVVEGADGSGSMITAEHAMEFGRDVYAVPGAVTNPLSSVPLRLLRDGATLIRGARDLLDDLACGIGEAETPRPDLPPEERRVLELLAGPTLPERIASAAGGSLPDVVGLLMRLELRGLVRNVGGRYESTLRGAAASR
jgi:DNA processing protein